MNSEQMKIIEETPKKYVLEDEHGERKTFHKIDMESIKKSHRESVHKVAEALTGEDLESILTTLTNVLNNTPDINEYLLIAQNISSYLKRIYDKVGSPNLLWHPIKNIDPDIYGKAQTLTIELNDLFQQMVEVAKVMEELGKIQDFTFEAESGEMKYEELPRKGTHFYTGINFSFVK